MSISGYRQRRSLLESGYGRHDAGSDEAANGLPAGASEVSIATLNSSGFSMTIVSPAGSPVAGSSNLTVTVITGCPGDNRRLRAIDGCGGDISTVTAAAGTAFSTVPNEGDSCPAS
jgi:hypothetical protein